MSEVRKAVELCDWACEGSNILAATTSRRKASRRLHGMFSEKSARVVKQARYMANLEELRKVLDGARAITLRTVEFTLFDSSNWSQIQGYFIFPVNADKVV